MAAELMSREEMYRFGTEILLQHLQKEGHQVLSVNREPDALPHIMARHEGELEFILVSTSCYPNRSRIEDPEMASRLVEMAKQFGAICYYACIGLTNALGMTDEEMSTMVRRGSFEVRFEGLQLLSELSKPTC